MLHRKNMENKQTERSYPALDDIPLHHPFLETQELRDEGVNAFNKLIAILSMTSM